ncbi:MAG TPA: DUF5658 family protein [Planctomycetaceae bacterium]
MPPPSDDRRDEPGEPPGRFLLGDRLPLETETAAFILVNILDIFLTYLLLRQGGHDEGNPVARFFLNHWGLSGLVYFKMGMVAFVCLVTQLIARYRLRTARALLYLLTAIVGAVVVYSLVLLMRAG